MDREIVSSYFLRRTAACRLLTVALLLFGPFARATEMQVIHGSLPAITAHLQSVGRLPDSNSLDLVIALPLRDKPALTNLLRQLYDPASPNFHRYLRPEEFAAKFGPDERDYQALISFARTNGLTITGIHPNRTLLEVRAPVRTIERVFHTNFRLYRHPTEDRNFFAPDVEPSIESAIPILAIGGLDNYVLPHPKSLTRSFAQPGANLLTNNFRAAYVPGVSLNGEGQTVGLLEFDGYYSNDIAAYENQIALSNNVPLTNVLLEGATGATDGNSTSVTEVSLDIEMAITMANGLSQVIVYEGIPNGYGNTMLNRMATDNLAKQISSSWNFGIDSGTEQIFQQFAAQGQSFFNSSGDAGAYNGGVPTPDDNPYITIVGGTSLTTSSSNGAWLSETVWNEGGVHGSGGGISSNYAIPWWQQGVNMTTNLGSTSMRNIPDVAMVASGIFVISNNGQPGYYSGTSFSAPLWAGFMALVNQQAAASGAPPAGFINPALYWLGSRSNYSLCLHDILTGNNTNASSPSRFFAAPGYDLCTGWGTPAGSNLIAALATPEPLLISPPNGFSTEGPGGGPFNFPGQTFTLTNQGSTALNWNLGDAASWLSALPANGTLLPGGPATVVTVGLGAAVTNLPIGNYTATLWFTNQSDGFVQLRQFALTVWPSLIQNGGFETGTFADWTESGNTNRILIWTAPAYVHSGTYGAEVGPSGSLGYLSQTVATIAGQNYLLSLWLDSPDGKIPNEFLVSWNGTNLFDRTNLPAIGWTNLQYIVQATGTSSELEIGIRDDTSFFGLDDISLLPVYEPVLQPLGKSGSAMSLAWNSQTGLGYQVQYKTNLSQTNWINLGAPVTSTNSPITLSDPTATNARRFYRLILLP